VLSLTTTQKYEKYLKGTKWNEEN